MNKETRETAKQLAQAKLLIRRAQVGMKDKAVDKALDSVCLDLQEAIEAMQ